MVVIWIVVVALALGVLLSRVRRQAWRAGRKAGFKGAIRAMYREAAWDAGSKESGEFSNTNT